MHEYDEEKMKYIAYRIQYHVRKNNMSYVELSRRIGCSRDTMMRYVNIEYEEASMNIENLKRIANVFQVNEYYFCNDYHVFLDKVNGGSYLKILRMKHKLSQLRYSQKLNIPYSNYKTYESGKAKVPYKVWLLIK